MDKRQAVKDMLSNLSKNHFKEFCHELVSRKEKPQVARNRVEEKNFLDILEVLISTFDETGAVEVAAELLNGIKCNKEANQLLAVTGVKCSEPGSPNMEATGGPSSENESRDTAGPSAGGTAQYTMVDGEHFVDKHRIELINRVCSVADVLDQLLKEKVIQQAIYEEILLTRPSQEQMRKLFNGPLKSAGLGGKEVFYRILVVQQHCLIDDLKKKS